MSRPAILKISLFFEEKESWKIIIDFLPEIDLKKEMQQNTDKNLMQILKSKVPKRFVETMIELKCLDCKRKIAEISKKNRQKIFENFKQFSVQVKKTESSMEVVWLMGKVIVKKPQTFGNRLKKGGNDLIWANGNLMTIF